MPNPQLTALQQQLQAELDVLTTAQQQIDADATTITALQSQVASVQAQLDAANAEIAKLTAPAPVTPPVTPPPTTTPAQTLPFAISRTGQGYTDFGSAHAAAQDGDTITVLPLIYNVSPDGFSIYKGLTVQSAVPGQKYKLVVAPNSAGAIGSGVGIPCSYRSSKLGLNTRFAVTIQDAEICATALTFVTGKAAVFLDCASGTAPCDLTLRNCYIHDFDQGVEAGNEYDPATRLSTVTIDACDIEQTGDIASGDNNHCLYIGQIAGLTMTNTTVKNVPGPNWTGPNYVSGSIDGPNYWPVGMVVKTRTKATMIDGCTLIGSANSNLVECGNGGDLLIQNCQLEQGQYSDGNALISYGRFITATESKDATKLVANDGRTNRLRVIGCTLKNDCTSKPMQWIELSNTCTQATAPSVTYQIGGNTFTDSPAGLAIDPTKGYPGLTASQVFGIPLVIDGSVQTVAKAAQQQPPVTQPPVTQPPVTPAPTGDPAPWYAATLLNGWSRLPHPAIYSQVQATAADRANPDDVGASYKPIYPFTGGDSAGYVTAGNKPWPLAGQAQIAGVDPIPGYLDFRGDQGAIPCYNATVVRRGKAYKGTFLLWLAQGGHGVGLNNQILGYHVDSGVFLDLTQQSIPPCGCPDANASAWSLDGRPISTHGYNGGVFDQRRQTALIPAGPGQVGGPAAHCVYSYKVGGDGWAGPNPNSDPSAGKDYFVAGSAYPNGRNSCQIIDNGRDELWNSFYGSDFANPVLIAHTALAPGSSWQWAQADYGNGTPLVGKASTVGFAFEGEPWLAWFSEVNPNHAVIVSRDYKNGNGRLVTWNVPFVPKDGDANNAIPVFVTDPAQVPNVDSTLGVQGIPATVVHGFDDRVFYVIVYCLDSTTALGDVYRVTPPAAGTDFVQGIGTANPVVVPWVSEKLTQDAASAFQLPTKGNSTGGWYPAHKTAMYLPAPMKGIFFVHDPSKSPQFFRLP